MNQIAMWRIVILLKKRNAPNQVVGKFDLIVFLVLVQFEFYFTSVDVSYLSICWWQTLDGTYMLTN